MNNDIEAKLKAYAATPEHYEQCMAENEGSTCCIVRPECVDKIKQAFKDAGYCTGQGWYEALAKKLDEYAWTPSVLIKINC